MRLTWKKDKVSWLQYPGTGDYILSAGYKVHARITGGTYPYKVYINVYDEGTEPESREALETFSDLSLAKQWVKDNRLKSKWAINSKRV